MNKIMEYVFIINAKLTFIIETCISKSKGKESSLQESCSYLAYILLSFQND